MYSNSYENIRMMFWNGTEKAKDWSIIKYKLDQAGIEHSIWRALRDYTARTEERKDEDSSASADTMLKAIPKFVEAMKNYFNDPVKESETEYDSWHHTMCELFIEEIKENKIRSNVKYGKAQKIVNMSIKTIFCLNGAEEKSSKGYFKFCHMPLDSITLNWFRNYVAKTWFNIGKKRDEKIKISLEGGPFPKWSNLSYSDSKSFSDYCQCIERYNNKAPYDYMFFVAIMRKYFEKNNTMNPYDGLTPFQAEFYIWVEAQYESAAESLLKQNLIKKLQSNNSVLVGNKNIKLLNDKISKLLSELSEYY